MKIHFLGTNGWYDSATGETVCTFIDSKEAYVILDAGNAFRKIGPLIKDASKPIVLLLSHFHLDHINGLHTLPLYSFRQGIDIYGQNGSKKILAIYLAPPFTASPKFLGKKIRVAIHDLIPNRCAHLPFNFESRFLLHKDPCLGYALYLEGKKIAYCTDTGLCKNYFALAKNADLLISECSWKYRDQNPEWPHLAPEDAAEAARKSNARKLVLTHFDAFQYETQNDRRNAQARAKKIFRKTIAAADGLTISV